MDKGLDTLEFCCQVYSENTDILEVFNFLKNAGQLSGKGGPKGRPSSQSRLKAPLCLALISLLAQQSNLLEAAPEPSPYSRMHMVYEKSFLFLQIPVLEIEIHFDEETADRFQRFASEELLDCEAREKLATAAINATHASIHVRFLRSVKKERFLDQSTRSLQQAWREEMISRETLDRLLESIPEWYAFLSDRDILEGDEITYQIGERSVRLLYTTTAGQVLMDQLHSGPEDRVAVMGSYLARGSDFRRPLIDSLLSR